MIPWEGKGNHMRKLFCDVTVTLQTTSHSALLKETNLLSEPLLGHEEKLCSWTQLSAGGQFQFPFLTPTPWAATIPSSVTYWTQRQILSHHLACSQLKLYPGLSYAFRRNRVRPWPFHSLLCFAFNSIESWWRLPYSLSPFLVWHSGVHSHDTVHGPALNQTQLPAFTA